MSGKTMKHVAALAAGILGIVGAAAIITASPAPAAPIVPGTAAIKGLASAPATNVSYRCCCGRRHFVRRFYHRDYVRWRHGYGYADCGYTFPATCGYPYPYFGFVYGWHGIW